MLCTGKITKGCGSEKVEQASVASVEVWCCHIIVILTALQSADILKHFSTVNGQLSAGFSGLEQAEVQFEPFLCTNYSCLVYVLVVPVYFKYHPLS